MLGDMIRKLRELNNMTQNNLGKKLSLSASTIGMYEQNRRLPDIDTLISMCKIFSVSSDYLLEITDDSAPFLQSVSRESIHKRINLLIHSKNMDISQITSVTKIRKQRLEDILKDKKPDINELIILSEFFLTSTDYLLCLTDDNGHSTNTNVTENSFHHRLATLMNELSEIDLADKLDISSARLNNFLNGKEKPTPKVLSQLSQLFGKSTDYLLGLSEKSRACDKNNTYPFQMDQVCLDRIQHLLVNDYDENMAAELGITTKEYYLLFHYGFVPHLSVIQKLCRHKNISPDYLFNFSDSTLTVNISRESDEEELLLNYRKLGKLYRKKVEGTISEQIIQQERDSYLRSSSNPKEAAGK